MADTKPFTISIDQTRLDRLHQKLSLTELPKEVRGAPQWSRGVPLAEIERLLEYWKSHFSWRAVEKNLNDTLPQFTTQLEAPAYSSSPYTIHFVHKKSEVANAIPLLFLHGWPGSFTEVSKILPMLVKPASPDQPAFHVIAPSYLDFGFSDASNCAGFNVVAHAHVCHSLMQKLGYEKYVIQGGDMGAVVARVVAQYYPSSLQGHLLNDCWPCEPTKEQHPELWNRQQSTSWTEEELAGLARMAKNRETLFGYHMIQSTKPLTLGYSMADSPVGLLAWIYEKMHDWADGYAWTEDEILTWVCIYYFSKAGPNASQQIYLEGFAKPDEIPQFQYSSVPLGITRYPHELGPAPKLWYETQAPVVFWKSHSSGGHFAASERPNEVVQDLREMFGRSGPCAGVCGESANGYH